MLCQLHVEVGEIEKGGNTSFSYVGNAIIEPAREA
jgi:hypothetical protein